MKSLVQLALTLAIGGLQLNASAKQTAQQPAFWEQKPAVLKTILKDRKVPVFVEVKPAKNDQQQHMKLEGAGLIHAPVEFASRWILDYSNLKRVSSYVQEAKWNERTKTLFLHTAAFGYHARMHIEMLTEPGPKQTQVKWKIKKGFLRGLSGTLTSRQQGFAKTLFSVRAADQFEKTKIPKIFLEFGFEVVIQKFAENVRSLIEQDFKKGT